MHRRREQSGGCALYIYTHCKNAKLLHQTLCVSGLFSNVLHDSLHTYCSNTQSMIDVFDRTMSRTIEQKQATGKQEGDHPVCFRKPGPGVAPGCRTDRGISTSHKTVRSETKSCMLLEFLNLASAGRDQHKDLHTAPVLRFLRENNPTRMGREAMYTETCYSQRFDR
jgi:hypothetical protein